jgi:Skp family chaperone for outer membrane proteins
MNIKGLILKSKRLIICFSVAFVLGIFGGTSNMPKEEYNNLLIKNEQIGEQIVELDKTIEDNKSEEKKLQAQKEEKDKLAKEEAERKAKEAKEKEEAERKAQEEANRIAQQEQNNNSTVASGGNNVVSETPIGQMVWLSATGKKYHSISNCGNMNPAKARQVTIESAISKGYGACSKCY